MTQTLMIGPLNVVMVKLQVTVIRAVPVYF